MKGELFFILLLFYYFILANLSCRRLKVVSMLIFRVENNQKKAERK